MLVLRVGSHSIHLFCTVLYNIYQSQMFDIFHKHTANKEHTMFVRYVYKSHYCIINIYLNTVKLIILSSID